ncbi:carboxypeptidase regulatory-like domain-containing protein [Methylolobus aquaticus]
MKSLLSSIMWFLLCLSGVAVAGHAVLKEQTQGAVTFITGGVGKEEQSYLRGVRNEYNLHLLFAMRGSGAYVANVQVRIDDAAGTTVLDAGTEGPHMFLRLKPGSYVIAAERGGHQITHKVKVALGSGRGRADLVFAFPGETTDR